MMDWLWNSLPGGESGEDIGAIALILVGWFFLVAVSYVLSTISVLALSLFSLIRARFKLQAALWWLQAFIGVASIGVIHAIPFVIAVPLFTAVRLPEPPALAPITAVISAPLLYASILLAGVAAGALLILIIGGVVRAFAWASQKGLNAKARRIASGRSPAPFVLLLRPFTADRQVSAQTDSAFRLGAGFRRISGFVALLLLRIASPAIRLFLARREEEGQDEERRGRAESPLENFVEQIATLSSKFHPFDTEVAIGEAVRPMGFLVAVGKPKTLYCGAGRVEVAEEADWQAVVSDLAARASAIVFIPGHGEGTYWEIANIAKAHAEKTIFVMLPNVEMASVDRFDAEKADPLFRSLNRAADETAGLGDNRARRRATFDPGDWVEAARAARRMGLDLPAEYNLRGGAFYLSDEGWRREGAFSVLFPGAITRCCRRLLRQRRQARAAAKGDLSRDGLSA